MTLVRSVLGMVGGATSLAPSEFEGNLSYVKPANQKIRQHSGWCESSIRLPACPSPEPLTFSWSLHL